MHSTMCSAYSNSVYWYVIISCAHFCLVTKKGVPHPRCETKNFLVNMQNLIPVRAVRNSVYVFLVQPIGSTCVIVCTVCNSIP